jgi:putative methyltransferase
MALRLHRAELDKGLTLARQSHDPTTLKNIKRSNIRLDAYAGMQKKANHDGIPVYSEVILGLPGETEASFKKGVEEILASGISNQLFIYHAELLPNTAMSSPEHRQQFGIESVRIPLRPTHTLANDSLVTEYDEIIIGTHAMPPDDWIRCTVWSWILQALHGMKLGYFLMTYTHETYGFPFTHWVDWLMDEKVLPLWSHHLKRLEAQAAAMARGEGKGQHLPAWGDVFWEEEEATFLELQANRETWDKELEAMAMALARLKQWDPGAMRKQCAYQSSRIPRLVEHYQGDKKRYAKEVIIHGRKSGTNVMPV